MASNRATLSGMAGEFLTAGQLLKRGLLVSVTMGNAKAIDLFAYNEQTKRKFLVQVKTRTELPRKKAPSDYYGWILREVDQEHIYVFVVLNKLSEQEEFFVIKGETLAGDYAKFFGPGFDPKKPKDFDGVGQKSVQDFKDNWIVFSEKSDHAQEIHQ